MTKALTERRAADRQTMANTLAQIATECGATAEIEKAPFGDMSRKMIMVRIRCQKGLQCAVEFDGESCQPDVFVNGWNIDADSDACLADTFPGSVNHYHFRKSTTVSEGFAALCDHVRDVCTKAAVGSIFDAERERDHVAENGTWQERRAQFQAWREQMESHS